MSTKPQVAVLGANGFIGSRLVETLILADLADVRPIVRSFQGMVRPARFDTECRVADATDAIALEPHLKAADIVFNCVTGGGETIIKNIDAVYRASAKAGVRRLVHLSSAVVHGNSPAVGTTETELLAEQPFEYNVKKVAAEHLLWRLAKDRAVETVVLRPLIVYGPRSTLWTARIAADLSDRAAYLIDHGSGICNTVFIDNLVDSMWLAAFSKHAVNQSFFITDGEKVTWRELYLSVVNAIGGDFGAVRNVDRSKVQELIPRKIEDPFWHSLVRYSGNAMKQCLPPIVKLTARKIVPRMAASGLRQFWESAHPSDHVKASSAARNLNLRPIDPYLATLQDCRYQLPITKAETLLGYFPKIDFVTGCAMTRSWIQFYFGLENFQSTPTIDGFGSSAYRAGVN